MRLKQLGIPDKTVCLEQDAARALNNRFTNLRDCDAACCPIEQSQSKLFLECLNTAAKSRLAEMHPFRRLCEAAFLSERDRMAQAANTHFMHFLQSPDVINVLALCRSLD
jgi:hypothetical protein